MDINNIPDILKELYNETRARLLRQSSGIIK